MYAETLFGNFIFLLFYSYHFLRQLGFKTSSNSFKLHQILSKLSRLGQILSNSVKFCQIPSNSIKFHQTCPNLSKTCPNSSKLIQTGQNCYIDETCQNCYIDACLNQNGKNICLQINYYEPYTIIGSICPKPFGLF